MSEINVSVGGGPGVVVSVAGDGTTATVTTGGTVNVTLTESNPSGVGPAGFTALAAATDVNLEATSDGDVLRYSSGKWRNYPDANLVDGGNW